MLYILINSLTHIINKILQSTKKMHSQHTQLQTKYKVINLQNLPRKKQFQPQNIPLESLVQNLDKPTEEEFMRMYSQQPSDKPMLTFQEKLYCYKDTAATNSRVTGQYHNFFNAFFFPYNQHGDVLLVPDDVWLMISLYLSKYIDNNAQKLRNQFVTHQGQKQLTIVENANSVEQSLKMQRQWDFFFQEIIKQIQKNTLPGVVEALGCNFTTTTEIYKLISTSIIMSSFKQYFSYGRMICGCGLNNVYFAGSREDWVKLIEKTVNLNKYDVDGELKKYVSHMEVILKNFLHTYDQKPNLKWWNTIMTTQERRIGSGGETDTSVQGWILHFYGIYDKIDSADSLPKTSISVPIKLVNKLTQMEKKLELITDWISVSKVNQNLYKPDIGMCIVEKERKKLGQ